MMLSFASSAKLPMLSWISLASSSGVSWFGAMVTLGAVPPLLWVVQSFAFLQQSLARCPLISQ